MTNLSPEVCQKLRDARRAAKLSQSVVASEVGCKQSALSMFEQGDGTKLNDAVIRKLAEGREGLVYLLWGSYAQKKASFVDRTRNLVLSCAHPSPLSAYRGFFGCGHFKAANEYLVAHGQEGISW